MNGTRDWAWLVFVGLMLGATAHASKIYSFTGKVSQISGSDVQVTRGSDVREFSVSGLNGDQKDSLRVGEEITIWYSMEAQGVTKQQAGQEASPIPPNIQDDRAFYNAKMDLKIERTQGA